MDRKFGYFVFGGLLIGSFLGWAWSAGGNPIMGLSVGALVGLALGWFIAAANLQK